MTKLRKKRFTIIEQAMHKVHGFRNIYQQLDDKMRLSGHSDSTLSNYARKLAQISLYFDKLPYEIPEDDINKYLAKVYREKAPSLSDFKFKVFGLRFCYKMMGMHEKTVKLPQIKRDKSLPTVLNHKECKALFAAPDLLKLKELLAFTYSAGLRAGEVSRLKIADIDSERGMIHVRKSKYNKDRYVPLSS